MDDNTKLTGSESWHIGPNQEPFESSQFHEICGEVEQVIRKSGNRLVAGFADGVAVTIMKMLIVQESLVPVKPITEEKIEAAKKAVIDVNPGWSEYPRVAEQTVTAVLQALDS